MPGMPPKIKDHERETAQADHTHSDCTVGILALNCNKR